MRGLVLVMAWCVFAVSGCGGSPSTSNPGPAPPHEGRLVLLAGGRGYLEIVHKPAAKPKGPTSGEASFYFLTPDGLPRTPAPTGGTLVLGKKSVPLVSAGEALTTPDGPSLFPKGELDGLLNVELEGKPVSIPLGVR